MSVGRLEKTPVSAGYVDVNEAARFFGVCVRTISNWRREGFPVVKAGGRILIDLKEADAWLRSYFGTTE